MSNQTTTWLSKEEIKQKQKELERIRAIRTQVSMAVALLRQQMKEQEMERLLQRTDRPKKSELVFVTIEELDARVKELRNNNYR